MAVHEAGHFLAARAQGIHVEKFSIGFGPVLFKWAAGGVEYSLRALPLGGFVAFPTSARLEAEAGEAGGSAAEPRGGGAADKEPARKYEADDPDLLENRSVLQRLVVVSAGVAANLLLATALMDRQALTVGIPEVTVLPGVEVPMVIAGAPAELAGLREGDVIRSIDGRDVSAEPGTVDRLAALIKQRAGGEVDLIVESRGDAAGAPGHLVRVLPEERDGAGYAGVQMVQPVERSRVVASGPLDGLRLSARYVGKTCGDIAHALAGVVLDPAANMGNLSGPVKIVQVGAEFVDKDKLSGLIEFATIISLNLAVVNSVPFPGLDGWQAALLTLEGARRGEKLSRELESSLSYVGLLTVGSALAYSIFMDTLGAAMK